MNSGDVFLLDMGMTIYVWNGSQAGRLERVKGMDIARRIRDEERGGKAKIEDMGKLLTFCHIHPGMVNISGKYII